MTKKDLMNKLLFDLTGLGFPVNDVSIEFRPYSKCFYGKYFPASVLKNPRIFIYPYLNEKGDFLDYIRILKTAIHEFCHHLQHSDKAFCRKKGVMHDVAFWELYSYYCKKAELEED